MARPAWDYFLICYSFETGELRIDDLTALDHFSNGLMQSEEGSWLDQSDYPDEDYEAKKKVEAMVELFNSVLKDSHPLIEESSLPSSSDS